jgi:molybdopterin-guanine dinucleotide biosynthesis protein A
MSLVAGAVLTGGSSRRMGRDKALIDLAGRPLVSVAVRALSDAGVEPVVAVGGDLDRLVAHGLAAIADEHPGEGPLGGILTALAWSTRPVTVVLSCDLPTIGSTEVTGLLAVLDDHPAADVLAAAVGGRPQFLAAVYRARARRPLEAAFAAGERAVRRAVGAAGLDVVLVEGLDPDRLIDVDHPSELEAAADAISRQNPGMGEERPGPQPNGVTRDGELRR